MRPCLGCGQPATSTRCDDCNRDRNRKRNAKRTHYQGDWQRVSRQARHAHLEQHGPMCPGYNRPAHMVDPLTLQLDHTTGLVLCHRCNVNAGPASH